MIIAGKGVDAGGVCVELTSPQDYLPYKRVIDAAIAQHMSEGKPIESLPFSGFYGRTADTEHAAAGCRVLLGNSLGNGTLVYDDSHSDNAAFLVGLLAAWN